MKRTWMLLGVIVATAALTAWYVRTASAHCDTMSGPVVTAAQAALKSGNVNLVLPWVSEKDEAEIRAAFTQTEKVRALGPEARALADRYFFETLVRLHRAGEGAPYTGLKPAGTGMNPAIEAADKAFATGSAEALTAMLTKEVAQGVKAHFAEAMEARSKDVNNVAARRRGVHGYVEFVHYVEGIYSATTGAAGDDDEGAAHAK